jgi:hypothetical protein
MSDDAHLDEVMDQLETAFGVVIRDCFGSLPPMLARYTATRLCETLRDELRGMRVTVPARNRVDAEAILRDWRDGLGLHQVMERNACSRATAYRYHPSRYPQAADSKAA